MSATAALEKWLELKKKSALPIFSAQPILGELQAQSSDLSLVSEKILNVVIFSLVYILILILAGFMNWFSRYLYFKAKRPNCTIVHSLYYTMLYPSGIGKFYYKYENKFFFHIYNIITSSIVQFMFIQFLYLYVYCTCIVFYLYLNCTCTILVRVLYYTCNSTVLTLYLYLCLEAVDMSILYQNKDRSCEAPEIKTSTR